MRSRFGTVRDTLATISAGCALLVGGFLAAYAVHVELIQNPPPGFFGFWDPPSPPTRLGIFLIVALLAGSVATLWKKTVWPVLLAWALLLIAALWDSLVLVIPSLAAREGLHPPSKIADMIGVFLHNDIFVAALCGLVLALPSWLRSWREKATTPQEAEI